MPALDAAAAGQQPELTRHGPGARSARLTEPVSDRCVAYKPAACLPARDIDELSELRLKRCF